MNIRFGGGATETILHPIVAVALIVTIALLFWLPRKFAVIPWLFTILIVPVGQVLVIGGVHFTVYRILSLFGLFRLCTATVPAEKKRLAGGFNAIDCAFILCAIFSFGAFTIQWMNTQALIKGFGTLIDAIGAYFVLRFFIRDREGVRTSVKVLAVIAILLAVCMTYEQFTGRNLFGLLGGAPVYVPIRDGKIRSMGSFEVYLTAGAFGATLTPLLIWLWSDAKSKVLASFGLLAATVVTLTSNSSTPLLAYVAGFVGICFWPFRRRMRALRWVLVLTLMSIHLSMNAPIWALIARIDLTGSSSGFHRYILIDQCIRHFGDWWLIGTKTYDQWGADLWDLCDQYVATALTGGLATLGMFILVISLSFGRLGTARRLVEGNWKQEWFLWCLCAALLSHVVAYFGVAYFDQIQVSWYTLLAIIAAALIELYPVRMARSSVLCETQAERAFPNSNVESTTLVGR